MQLENTNNTMEIEFLIFDDYVTMLFVYLKKKALGGVRCDLRYPNFQNVTGCDVRRCNILHSVPVPSATVLFLANIILKSKLSNVT